MKKTNEFSLRLWQILYPLGIYYVAISIGIICAQLIFGTDNRYYMVCKTIGSLLALFFVFQEYKTDRRMEGRYGLRAKPTAGLAEEWMLSILSMICLSVGLNNLILMSPLYTISDAYQDASAAFYGGSLWAEILGSALVTPVLEELLHRGVIYPRLRRWMGSRTAILFSALIFAGLHFNLVQFVYAFALGLVLCFFAEKTKAVALPIALHVAANAFAVLRTETGFLAETVEKSPKGVGISMIFLGLGLLGLFLYNQIKQKQIGKNQ